MTGDTPAERSVVLRDGAEPYRPAQRSADGPGLFRRIAEQRDTRRRNAEAVRTAEQASASRSASRVRASHRPADHTVRTAEEIAPVPEWMHKVAVWLDRTLGAVPLVAPLGLSAWFTAHVFMDAPLNLPAVFAVVATGALEGGAWKLSRIYEKTLLEGDSTISLRVGLSLYLAIISGLIYWHSWFKAGQTFDMGWNWIPAAACAVLSWLGIYIWGRTARHQHRVLLRRDGRIDKQAPKFSILSWLLTPVWNARALRHAVIFRIDSPVLAMQDCRLFRAAGRPKVWPPAEHDDEQDAERPVPFTPAPPPAVPPAPAVHGTAGIAERTVQQSAFGGTRPAITASVPSHRPDPDPVPRDDGTEADSADDGGTDSGGTRDGDGTDSADVVDPEMLRLADHMLTVAEAFPDWQTSMPSVSKATEAIAAARAQQGDTFNSRSTAAKVINALKRVATHDDPARTLTHLRVLEEQ